MTAMARSTANARKPKPFPRKRSADDWVRRGGKYDHAGDEKKAMQCYLAAFNEDPTHLDALKSLSRKMVALTERRMAIEILEQAIKANPGDTEVYLILGNLALEMRMLDGALSIFTLLCQMTPDNPTGPNNVATVLREMERFDEAIAVLQEAIPRFQSAAALWNTLAAVVSARDGIDAGLPFYEEALRLNPRQANVWSNLAKALDTVGRFEDAVEAGRKAIAIDTEATEAHYAMATALLSLGRLPEGWEEYEWRQHWRRPMSLRYALDCDRWDGTALDGQSLLICPEQGLGDELLFATCIPDIARLTDKLYIGCDRRLVSLYERSFPGAVVGGYRDLFSNAHRYRDLPFIREQGLTPDRYIEVGSLFRHVRPDVADFPERENGYLVPDPERVAHWTRELAAMGPGIRVGIGWESMLRTNERNQHYVSLDQWKDILGVPGVTFVNLQHGDVEEQLQEVEASFNVTIHRPRDINLKDDLDDLAALTQALDLVICPSIAISCMALGVGTELWLLARRAPWWHFGQNGPADSTPISKSRLFTCDEEKGWQAALETAGQALRARAW
jgi:tetratricopeptide (TPR) repeat protein